MQTEAEAGLATQTLFAPHVAELRDAAQKFADVPQETGSRLPALLTLQLDVPVCTYSLTLSGVFPFAVKQLGAPAFHVPI